MPSWNDRPYFTSDGDDRPDERDILLSGRYDDADLDAIEQPAPYTAAEWNETEGARDHLTHAERVQEAGYDLGDPKGWSVP